MLAALDAQSDAADEHRSRPTLSATSYNLLREDSLSVERWTPIATHRARAGSLTSASVHADTKDPSSPSQT